MREVVAECSLHLYRRTRNQGDAGRLESFLADAFAPAGRGGQGRVAQRAAERSEILEDLRTGRMRHLQQGLGQPLVDEALGSGSAAE